jgi:PAS domain S-box-containing protein
MAEDDRAVSSGVSPSPGRDRDPHDLIKHAILESADGYAIFTMDLDRTVTSWNVGGEALFGWTAAEMIGQKIDLLFDEEDRARGESEKEFAQVLAEGRVDNARWFVSKNGQRFWAGGFTMLLKDGTGYLRVLRDWSPFWRNREAAREAEDRFLHIGNTGPAAVWVTDAEGSTIFISRSW